MQKRLLKIAQIVILSLSMVIFLAYIYARIFLSGSELAQLSPWLIVKVMLSVVLASSTLSFLNKPPKTDKEISATVSSPAVKGYLIMILVLGGYFAIVLLGEFLGWLIGA